ncbi:hypothetical protein [Orlajensenia leifsoniae]|uniref:Uncharacterized protein n=1 Tax=Orlajensenia leifsoniae TaxID=2561933 RepID=A0A4Y9R5Z1_9MICO|nr:hypothetical protein [Leifsonia flava]TFV99717.1 hypothetical protein E4M00_00475 [Leifsonia flava]
MTKLLPLWRASVRPAPVGALRPWGLVDIIELEVSTGGARSAPAEKSFSATATRKNCGVEER